MSHAVGVLALQGGFEPHVRTLARLGVTALEVRDAEALADVSHLVLPGGESTTLDRLLRLFDLRAALVRRARAGTLALFGTCAGAILLGHDDGTPPERLGLLDATLRRNGYGPQSASTRRRLLLDAFGRPFDCVFIRAPRFGALGPTARVLARDGDEPILVEGPGCLAATFHPELGEDPFLHRYFLDAFPVAGAPRASAAGG